MRPDLKYLIRDRFQGHEAPVDPGIWNAIEAKLAALPASDPVEELFRERFQEHEADVDPGLWDKINGQLGQGTGATVSAGAGASGGGILGWAAAGIVAIAVSVGVYLATNADKDQQVALVNSSVKEKVVTPPPVATVDRTDQQAPVSVTPQAEQRNSSVTESAPAAGSATLPVARENERDGPVAPADPAPVRTNRSVTVVSDERPGAMAEENGEGEMTTSNEAHANAGSSGTQVVENVMRQLQDEVKKVAMTAADRDPAGPELDDVPPTTTDAGKVDVPAVAQRSIPDIHLPNTFTPNGDGINDTYTVDRTGFRQMMIRIFSLQTNKLVFSTDSNEEWDGAGCEKGYYLVSIEAITEEGELVTKGKAVWLNNEY